jgi:hypothetical protein
LHAFLGSTGELLLDHDSKFIFLAEGKSDHIHGALGGSSVEIVDQANERGEGRADIAIMSELFLEYHFDQLF